MVRIEYNAYTRYYVSGIVIHNITVIHTEFKATTSPDDKEVCTRLVSAAIFSCIMFHMGEAQILVLVDCFCRPTDRHVRELNVGCVKSCQAIKFADTRSAAGCPRLPWPSRRRW